MNTPAKIKFSRGLRCKLFITFVLLIATLVFLLSLVHIYNQKVIFDQEMTERIKLRREQIIDRGILMTNKMGSRISTKVKKRKLAEIREIINGIVSENLEIYYIILQAADGRALIHTLKPEMSQVFLKGPDALFAMSCNTSATQETTKKGRDAIEFITPIRWGDAVWGILRVGRSLDSLNQEIRDSKAAISEQIKKMVVRSLLVALLFLGISWVIIFYLAKQLTTPLVQLTESVRKFAAGDYQAGDDIKNTSTDEVGQLARAFKEMCEKLRESHARIEEANRLLEQKVDERTSELKQANEEIRQSQKQLVQAEKMASLGQLVAGVAHEVNTPIGIGITAASHAVDLTDRITMLFNDKSMTKEMLTQYFHDIDEACQLVIVNLTRTGKLVENFKQISVDQVSHEQRVFNVKKYLDSVINSLSPKLKHTGQQVEIVCPESLLLDSYPGAFAQVITNFVMNSLIHGYEEEDEGIISINVTADNEQMTLIYRDDGKGIAADIIDKVFDPFVTTKRGEGGTGLGLNIVYNIITQTMGGTISCESEVGKGVKFTVTIPVNKR